MTPSHVETRENFTAYEEESGEQYRFVLPGSKLHPAEWEAVLNKLETLREKPRYVVASGSVPPGMPEDIYAKVARMCPRSRCANGDRHVRGRVTRDAERRRRAGEAEFERATDFAGAPLETEAARLSACRKLIDSGRAKMVALTLGEDGALLVTKDKALRAKPMRIDVVSAVGAGDSFLGGLVASLAKGDTLEHSFRCCGGRRLRRGHESRHRTLPRKRLVRLMPQVQIADVTTKAGA